MTIAIPLTPPATPEALRALSLAVGHTLPQQYVTFVGLHDGSRPDDNIFKVDDCRTSMVRRFIPVDEAVFILRQYHHFPKRTVAISEDACGNYVYMQPETGEVFYWDHELEGDYLKIASDLSGFLSLLEPFDPSSVETGEVISAWIDPDFLQELKARGEL